MEGYKKKNPLAESMKAASLAAGLSALPMIDNPAEAQNRSAERSENHIERREKIHESIGAIKNVSIIDFDEHFPGLAWYPGNLRIVAFSVALKDEGVIKDMAIFIGQDMYSPLLPGQEVKVLYKHRGPDESGNYYRIEELRDEDGGLIEGPYITYYNLLDRPHKIQYLTEN